MSQKNSALNVKKVFAANTDKKIIIEEKYKSGEIKEVSINCDCALDTATQNSQCTTAFYSFFKNGHIQEVGCQGFYNGTGTPVGEWKKYNSIGQISKLTYYHNDVFGKDYILIKYFKNGKLIKEEKSNNYILYETDKTGLPL